MARQNVEGNLYIGHIEPRLAHAGHYIGWTERPTSTRWTEHERGAGSPLIRAAIERGHIVTWAELGRGTRHDERKLHNRKRGADICPTCRERKLAG